MKRSMWMWKLILGLLLVLGWTSGDLRAEPFVIEEMPADFDGVLSPWTPARAPVAVDFNGDGQTSWYAGGRRIAHPKEPTPIDPLRYAAVALPSVSLPVCPSCTPRYLAFAVGDVNRDGHPDIVRLNEWNGHSYEFTLQVFLGNGSNGFTLGWRQDWSENPGYNSGQRYFQLALADFDRDGDPDLAVLSTYYYTNYAASPHRDQGSLSIRWNQNGEFGSQTTLQGQHFSDNSVLLVDDFDRDGDLDMFVNFSTTWTPEDTYSWTNRFFTNGGSGTFTASSDASFNAPLRFFDWNRDGWPDYLYLDNDGNGATAVRLRANNREGGFLGWNNLMTGLVSRNPYPVQVGDFNEDGFPDLVTAEGDALGSSPRLVMRLSGVGGALGQPLTLTSFASDILHIGVGDARGDADTDLLLRLANGSFRLVRNQAQRLRSARDPSTVAASISGLTRLAVADLNRDGIDDLLALQPGGPRMHWIPGNGSGGFAASEFKILSSGPSDFAVGDFNRDGRMDYAYVVPGSGEVRTVTQSDTIYFGWPDAKIADHAGAALVRAGNAINYNGTLDLLVSSSSNGGLTWFRNIGGAQSWSPTTVVATQDPIPQGLALAPLYFGFGDAGFSCAADGIAHHVNGYSNVLGWFRSARLLQVQSAPQTGFCTAVDLDDDAEHELVFVAGDGRLVSWKPEDSDIVTTVTIASSVPGQVNAIAGVDWNRDGLNDLLVATTQGLYLYAREGLEEAWVGRELYLDASLGVTDVVAIDVDRDSRPDAAFIHGNAVRVLRNASRIVDAVSVNYPSGLPLQLQPGQSGVAYEIGIQNPGRFGEDASIAVMGTRVTFLKDDNGLAGAAMTRAEVEQAVASISLLVNGQVIGTTGTATVDAGGSLQLSYNAVLGALVPIPPGEVRQMGLRVNLKASAASASYTSFFLVHTNAPGEARVLHAGQPVGKSGSFSWFVSNRVNFAPPPLTDAVFSSGFED